MEINHELIEKLKALVSENLTENEYRLKAWSLGCKRVVGPREITTREYRPDGSRVFLKVKDGKVVKVTFG